MLKLIFALAFSVTLLADLAALLFVGLTSYFLFIGTVELSKVSAVLPILAITGAVILGLNIVTGVLAWRIRGNERRVLDSLVPLTYAEFSEALRERLVVGDLHSRGNGDYHASLSRCYLLGDGSLAYIQGTLNPRRDRDNYRHFQHVEDVVV